jgi:hypothetical protein
MCWVFLFGLIILHEFCVGTHSVNLSGYKIGKFLKIRGGKKSYDQLNSFYERFEMDFGGNVTRNTTRSRAVGISPVQKSLNLLSRKEKDPFLQWVYRTLGVSEEEKDSDVNSSGNSFGASKLKPFHVSVPIFIHSTLIPLLRELTLVPKRT